MFPGLRMWRPRLVFKSTTCHHQTGVGGVFSLVVRASELVRPNSSPKLSFGSPNFPSRGGSSEIVYFKLRKTVS